MIQRHCNYCGVDSPLHAPWCQIGLTLADEKGSLSRSAPGQSAEDLPTGLIPPEELGGHTIPTLASKHPFPEGRGLEGSESKIKGKRDQRRELVIVEWGGEEPYYARAKLIEVLPQPDDSLLVVNVRELTQGCIALARKQSPDPLRREPYGIMISLEVAPLKQANQINPFVTDLAFASLRDPKGLLVSGKG